MPTLRGAFPPSPGLGGFAQQEFGVLLHCRANLSARGPGREVQAPRHRRMLE